MMHDLRSGITLKLLLLALAVAPSDEKRSLAIAVRAFAKAI